MPPTEDRSTPTRLRPPTVADAGAIWSLVRDDAELDLNSQYAYLVLCRDFATGSLIAESADGEIVGFAVGYRPPARPDTIFVWQIAVDRRERGRGLGRALLDELVDRSSQTGVRWLEATVTPSNLPSQRLFRSLAGSRGAELAVEPLFDEHLFSDGHEEERLVRIGPFDRRSARAPDSHAESAAPGGAH